MLRKDREMPRDFAEMVTDKCEWAVLAMTDTDGNPYCTPVTIARDGSFVYFHSSMALGKRTKALKANPRVCMTCVGDTRRATPEFKAKFTTEFESSVFTGIASEVTDEQEKIHALRLICERHVPANMGDFEKAIEKSLSITAVWKITIDEISGKRKKYDSNYVEMKYGRME